MATVATGRSYTSIAIHNVDEESTPWLVQRFDSQICVDPARLIFLTLKPTHMQIRSNNCDSTSRLHIQRWQYLKPPFLENLRTLRPRPYLLKLLPDRLFRKPPSLPSQHAGKLLVRLSNLFTHRDQAFGDIAVLFPQEQIRQFDEI
jgi:hypothetical protein